MYSELEILNNETLNLKISDELTLKLRKPSLKLYIKIMFFDDYGDKPEEEQADYFNDIMLQILNSNLNGVRYTDISNFDDLTKTLIYQTYRVFTTKIISDKHLEIPQKPTSKTANNYEFMPAIRRVIQYSGLNYYEVLGMPIDLFGLMHKNFIVAKLEDSDEGRKYLEDCKRYKNTDMDVEALKKLQGGEIVEN